MPFWVVIPTYSKDFGYRTKHRRNVLGPFRSWDKAQSMSDELKVPIETSEIVELDTSDRDEAVRLLLEGMASEEEEEELNGT